MAKRQHVIELNGKQYDALTGKIVGHTAEHTGVKHVDGFVRRKSTASAPAKATPTPATKVHHTTTKSKTLMRTTVAKPVQRTIHAKAAPVTATTPATTPPEQPTAIVPTLKPERILRAHHVAKSTLIRKFSSDRPTSVIREAVLAVKQAPEQAPPLTDAAHTIATPAADGVFEKALENATSHMQQPLRKKRLHERVAKKLHIQPRTVIAGSLSTLTLLVGAFWAYQHMPSVAMRIATARAGVAASLPAYQPAGYSLKGPIEAAPGKVSVQYTSNSDDRAFKIVQQSSDWNSQTLLDNFVLGEHNQYQSMQIGGRTVYLYDSGATWVDGGIWYQINGDSSLSSEQIRRIIDGL